MNIAQKLFDGELIEAEELRFILKDQMPEFICPDESCGVALIPASYQDHNKQRPHFRTLKNHDHSPDCKFSKYIQLLEIGGKRKITFEEFENLPVPTKLVKQKPKIKEDKVFLEITAEDIEITHRRKGNSGSFEEGGNSFKSVTTISQIVDFYLSCPFNRDIKLNLLGVEKKYMHWFKRLKNTLKQPELQEYKIYFGQLHSSPLYRLSDENHIRLQLFDCEGWHDLETGPKSTKTKEQINPIFVTISKKGLSSNKISRIIHEMDYALHEHRKAYLEERTSGKKPFVFFLGQKANLENPYEYEVLDGYFVARYTEIKQTIIN